jgi:hypothetical protein
MKLTGIPFSVIDWANIAPQEHKGEAGTSFWRVVEQGNVRIRKVEYSAGFRSDHWCPRGHIGLVLEGELMIDLKDGRHFVLGPGQGFEAADDEVNPHFAWTKDRTVIYLVD